MIPRRQLRRLDKKRERVIAHAEVKRLVRRAREESELSQEDVGEALGLSAQQVAYRENVESEKQWSGADLLKLFEVLPGLSEAVTPAGTSKAASSMEEAVTALTLRAAELGALAIEAKRDGVITPAEAERLRRLIIHAKSALATAESTLEGETLRVVRSSR